MTVTLTPESACVLRQLLAAHPRPVPHGKVNSRAVHRLVRTGALVRYARISYVQKTTIRRLDPHYELTPLGEAVALALPDVLPPHPFTLDQLAS
jgi:hypothetical protein